MPRILLTHSPETLAQYYGERALAGLRSLGEVRLHAGSAPLEGEALIAAAADCDLVVALAMQSRRAVGMAGCASS